MIPPSITSQMEFNRYVWETLQRLGDEVERTAAAVSQLDTEPTGRHAK